MKAKLLRKLRSEGRNQISIHGYKKADDVIVGMTIGMSSRSYSGLFEFGNTKEDVLKKAETIYLNENIDSIRNEYKKYSKLSHSNCR